MEYLKDSRRSDEAYCYIDFSDNHHLIQERKISNTTTTTTKQEQQ